MKRRSGKVALRNYVNYVELLIIGSFFLCPCVSMSFSEESSDFIATSEAIRKYSSFLKNKTIFVFPELRENPIKWNDSIPQGKIKNYSIEKPFLLAAQPNEYYVYQLGVWVLKKDAEDIQIEFSDLKDDSGTTIPLTKMTCFNKEGINFKGEAFSKNINVSAGRVQALWLGVNLDGIEKGSYTGSVSVIVDDEKQTIPLQLNISGEVIPNHGYNEGNRLSRLNWLNATVGIDDEITEGYVPVRLEGNIINILGRSLKIAKNGLPASITSFFSNSNQSFDDNGHTIVNQYLRFIIEKENGDIVKLIPGKLNFTHQTPSQIAWKVINKSKEFELECEGLMEFDGFVDYKLKLTSKKEVKVKNIRLEIPVEKENAEYMMGLGHEGGYRTSEWKWKWDQSKNQDMLWVGSVNAGLRVKWKADNYVRPLVNIYYAFGPLNLPESWNNKGKGGVDVMEKNDDVVIDAYSGYREIKAGDVLNFDFELLITPFKLIDNQIKYGDRYYHGGGTNTSVKIENAKKAGANIVNIHHAEDIYPYINYPYLDDNSKELTQLVASAHKEHLRMKYYYTTRELTKNLPEFWAFNSLNGEVIFPGPGNASRTEALHPNGPNEWLVKNLRENYIPAWSSLVKEGKFKGETDLSVITTPDSRLNNFYIAGLDWMVQNMGIDGVYIDDSALDRYTLRRARKIIDKYRPNGRMDLHSWNHFNAWAGYTNCLNLYMELLPYFDLAWIGEGRDYNRLPDHWLVEVSGIPFGITGQMLQDGGNAWRGMVYGITNRAGWTEKVPKHLWEFFDQYSIDDHELIGYWQKDCPVRCSNPMIKSSVFYSEDQLIISVANWNENDEKTAIALDWKGMGLNSANFEMSIPAITDFQEESTRVSLEKMIVPGKKGYLIVLKKKSL
ncbi:glycoside hydrolase domain-containing protein [Reichenbachiella sp. MALMAid0571]|uniref:glycoside hydrolase domain-containing protein n=1 Tax=Reichenbachiella sp. MALMAid0571 TaxID=3143939 RepID=UPI0032DE753C